MILPMCAVCNQTNGETHVKDEPQADVKNGHRTSVTVISKETALSINLQ